MNIRIDDLKLENREHSTSTGMVQAIVKVRKAGYVPPEVILRARIDDYLFTADIPSDELPQLDRNPQVVSVAENKKLRIIE